MVRAVSRAAESSLRHAPPRRQCVADRGAARRPSGRCVAGASASRGRRRHPPLVRRVRRVRRDSRTVRLWARGSAAAPTPPHAVCTPPMTDIRSGVADVERSPGARAGAPRGRAAGTAGGCGARRGGPARGIDMQCCKCMGTPEGAPPLNALASAVGYATPFGWWCAKGGLMRPFLHCDSPCDGRYDYVDAVTIDSVTPPDVP